MDNKIQTNPEKFTTLQALRDLYHEQSTSLSVTQ